MYWANFSISQFSFASCFYFATGFHGSHVILGMFLLTVMLVFYYDFHSWVIHSNLFADCVILYWHFVDVIWLGLYLFLYVLPHFIQ